MAFVFLLCCHCSP